MATPTRAPGDDSPTGGTPTVGVYNTPAGAGGGKNWLMIAVVAVLGLLGVVLSLWLFGFLG